MVQSHKRVQCASNIWLFTTCSFSGKSEDAETDSSDFPSLEFNDATAVLPENATNTATRAVAGFSKSATQQCAEPESAQRDFFNILENNLVLYIMDLDDHLKDHWKDFEWYHKGLVYAPDASRLVVKDQKN